MQFIIQEKLLSLKKDSFRKIVALLSFQFKIIKLWKT